MTLRRFCTIFLPLFFLIATDVKGEMLDLKVRADSAILINADTGAILYEKDSHTKRYPASITKIATALVTLTEKEDHLHQLVTAKRESVASITEKAREKANFSLSPHWIEVGGTHIGIKAGEELSLEALLYGMMLSSGNDAANVIADYVGGSMDRFVHLMNEHLASIGCNNTHFVCAHGHHHPDHYTTAYDMALMARKAMHNDTFRAIVSTERYRRPKTNKQEPTTLVQTNKLIRKNSPYYYDKAIGIKTGHGSRAKETLVAAAEYKGRTLIAVLLHANRRKHNFEDAIQLFEAAFYQPKLAKKIIHKGPQSFSLKLTGASSPVTTYARDDYQIEYYKGEELAVQTWLSWNKHLSLPIEKGEHVGNVFLVNDEKKILDTIPLFSSQRVTHSLKEKARFFFQGKASLLEYFIVVAMLAIVFFGYKLLPRRAR